MAGDSDLSGSSPKLPSPGLSVISENPTETNDHNNETNTVRTCNVL